MTQTSTAAAFPPGGIRGIVYAVLSRKGDVDDATLFALKGLRAHAQFVAVATGRLTPEAEAKLRPFVDELIDVGEGTQGLWAHQRAVAHLGGRVHGFDELILTGNGWFGPVGSFDATFERMDRRSVDVWAMTDRRDPRPRDASEGHDGTLTLNPIWLAVRRRALSSRAWSAFWRRLPPRPDLEWKARLAEARFGRAMSRAGFRVAAAFSSDDYPAEHADMFNADLMLRDGCPVVLRDVFDGYPLFFDQHAIVGRRIAAQMAERGYPVEMLWANLARTLAPKTLHTNGAMLEVLPSAPITSDADDLRVLGVVHVTQTDGLEDVLTRLTWVPGLRHVVSTVAAGQLADAVREAWSRVGADVTLEVREAPARTEPDTSVVFEECADLSLSGRFDLLVAVHTGEPIGLVRNAKRYFRRQQLDCLLADPGYIQNVLGLFRREPGLGLVFPPTPHIGMSTFGAGWLGLRSEAARVLAAADIAVPLDWASPHAPIGGMWIGRPEALRLLAGVDSPGAPLPAPLRTRLHAYAAGELGYHTRTVATAEHAGLSHNSLEYTTDHMSMTLYGYPAGYTSILHRAGPVGAGRGRDFARMYLRYRRPRIWAVVARIGRAGRALREMRRRSTGRGE